MARAKKPARDLDTCFTTVSIELTDEVIISLCSFINVNYISPEANIMTQEVESMLGEYPGMVETLDKAPSQASTREAIKPLLKHVQELWIGLNNLDEASRARLGSFDRLISEAMTFDAAASEICNSKQKNNGHGGRKIAMAILISRLSKTFRNFASVYNKKDELAFIIEVLESQSIEHPDDDRLSRYIPKAL